MEENCLKRMESKDSMDTVMARVTVKQAAKELNMDADTVRYLMQLDRLPIGEMVKRKGSKRATYYIYRGMLDAHKRKLSGQIV